MTLPLLALALLGSPQPRTATVTSYCSACDCLHDACGGRLRVGIVAADTHLHHGKAPAGALHVNGDRWRWYWHGDRIAFGAPINATLTVRDTGDAIRGRDRFDYCRGVKARCSCGTWGRKRVEYRVVRPHAPR